MAGDAHVDSSIQFGCNRCRLAPTSESGEHRLPALVL